MLCFLRKMGFSSKEFSLLLHIDIPAPLTSLAKLPLTSAEHDFLLTDHILTTSFMHLFAEGLHVVLSNFPPISTPAFYFYLQRVSNKC